jgi:hypothetical protein
VPAPKGARILRGRTVRPEIGIRCAAAGHAQVDAAVGGTVAGHIVTAAEGGRDTAAGQDCRLRQREAVGRRATVGVGDRHTVSACAQGRNVLGGGTRAPNEGIRCAAARGCEVDAAVRGAVAGDIETAAEGGRDTAAGQDHRLGQREAVGGRATVRIRDRHAVSACTQWAETSSVSGTRAPEEGVRCAAARGCEVDAAISSSVAALTLVTAIVCCRNAAARQGSQAA